MGEINQLLSDQIGQIIFLCVILIIILTNIKKLPYFTRNCDLEHCPRIDILIPMRNEEKNAYKCVNSLLRQDYPNYHIFVLDDHSTDKTLSILKELEAKSSKLTILQGSKLPQCWLGKHWACHQLAQLSKAPFILFLDADTCAEPGLLKAAISYALTEKTDLLTLFPREIVKTLGEKLVVPLMHWSLLSFISFPLAFRSSSPAFTVGIGQFMLYRREAYEQIGGFEAVRTTAVDDIEMSRLIKRDGLKWRIVNGSDYFACRMYSSFKESFNGFTRTIFAGFHYKIIPFVFVWVWLTYTFLSPLVVLALSINLVSFPAINLIFAWVQILLSLIVWYIPFRYFEFPRYLTLLYPLIIVLALTIALNSLISVIQGKTRWKNRDLFKQPVSWI